MIASSSASPHTPGDEFQKANRELITSLQHDNKSLRIELSDKERELKTITDELSRVISSNGKEQVSEQFLIASLQATRESISNLDSANQELLDALATRQEEIMRLSSAGMGLQSRFQKMFERTQELETENSNMCKAIDELLGKEGNELDNLRDALKKSKQELASKSAEFDASGSIVLVILGRLKTLKMQMLLCATNSLRADMLPICLIRTSSRL